MSFEWKNVQGIRIKQEEVLNVIKRFKLDVNVLAETKKKGKRSDEFNDFVHFYSGLGKDGSRYKYTDKEKPATKC